MCGDILWQVTTDCLQQIDIGNFLKPCLTGGPNFLRNLSTIKGLLYGFVSQVINAKTNLTHWKSLTCLFPKICLLCDSFQIIWREMFASVEDLLVLNHWTNAYVKSCICIYKFPAPTPYSILADMSLSAGMVVSIKDALMVACCLMAPIHSLNQFQLITSDFYLWYEFAIY